MNKRRPISIFFAIPCGEFFSVQNGIIKSVCTAADVHPIIVEDHTATENLWDKITGKIDLADYIIADISSKSPNIILELGYALREKKPRQIAIFIGENIKVPVDLQGFALQKYTGIRDFQERLTKWMLDNIPFVDSEKVNSLQTQNINYEEYFKDNDRFLRLWTFPPDSSYQLTHEGLRFTNSHFPIMTRHLALLNNYEFEFKAKIESSTVGWVVKGTRLFDQHFPVFCVMFNINQKGELRTHIFNYKNQDPNVQYKYIETKQVELNLSNEGWFTVITRINGDSISLIHNEKVAFEQDFTEKPYNEIYDFPNKQGEIGFRCHPGEQSTINYVKVKEI